MGAGIVVVALRPSGKRPAAAAAPPPAPAVVTGSLEVVTDPAGATVEIDGSPRGTTPVVVAGLAAGIHEVRLTRDGYAPVVLRKSVREGKDETLSAVMAKLDAPAAGSGSGGKPPRGGAAAGSGSRPAIGKGSGSASAPGAGTGSSAPTGDSDKGPKNPYGDRDPPPPPDRKDNPFGT